MKPNQSKFDHYVWFFGNTLAKWLILIKIYDIYFVLKTHLYRTKKDLTNKSTEKSVLLSYFFANIGLFHHEKSDIQEPEYFFEPSRQNRYHPVIWQYFLI